MDHFLVIWLARLGALACAFAAGWVSGRSVPGWQSAQALDEDDSDWSSESGCSSPRRFGLQLIAGFLALVCFAVFILAQAYTQLDAGKLGILLVVGVIAGYLVSVATNQGPMCPPE